MNRKTAMGLEKVGEKKWAEIGLGKLEGSVHTKAGNLGGGVLVSFQVCCEVIEAF